MSTGRQAYKKVHESFDLGYGANQTTLAGITINPGISQRNNKRNFNQTNINNATSIL